MSLWLYVPEAVKPFSVLGLPPEGLLHFPKSSCSDQASHCSIFFCKCAITLVGWWSGGSVGGQEGFYHLMAK